MKKINIIQFMPYFPPHKGGLETVGEELSYFYVSGGYGEVYNVIFDVGQNYFNENLEYIFYEGVKIGYKQKAYLVYLLPSFDIIGNFPMPKFWKKTFWQILKIISGDLKNNKTIVQTHTRFFLSSFLGGLFAKYYKIKWVHIEHGSDYVKLGSKIKSKISYVYDRLIGSWIFKKADKIVAISEGVKNFIEKEFIKNNKIEVIYNGIYFIPKEKKENFKKIKIGFVGRLVKLKGVDILIKSFKNMEKKYENIILEIVGDGEEKKYLKKLIFNMGLENKVIFLGLQNREFVNDFLSTCDILVNPSYQEGLPTTVLEGLLSKCVVIATDVGGTSEISDKEDLIIIEKGRVQELEIGLEKAIENYKKISGLSFESVNKKFDWEKNIEKYFTLYNDL